MRSALWKKRTLKTMITMSILSASAGAMVLSEGFPEAHAATMTPQIATDSLINPLVSNGAFSGAVLVAKHGQVLVDKGYGVADSLQKTTITPHTRFAIGSLTQGFVAVAIIQLAEQGKLSLSDTVSKFFTNANPAANDITVQDLLMQTSGAPATPNGASSVPGTVFQYSPLNYMLLGQIVRVVSGEPCADYIQQHILTPVGMSNTGFIKTTASAVPGMATGYDNANSAVSAVDLSPGQLSDSIGMYSTVGDLYKWDQALYSEKLIRFSSLKDMFTPETLATKALRTSSYGLGWYLNLDGTTAYEESTDDGYESFIQHNMKDDTTVIVLSNKDWAPVKTIANDMSTVLYSASLPYSTPSSTVGGAKQVEVNKRVLFKPDSRVSGGTTYMPIWYVGKALQSIGMQQGWDGTNRVWSFTIPGSFKTNFSNLSLGTGNTDIYINGQLVKRINTYAWKDPATGDKSSTTYAPVFYIEQLLRDAGVSNSWNGQSWVASVQ